MTDRLIVSDITANDTLPKYYRQCAAAHLHRSHWCINSSSTGRNAMPRPTLSLKAVLGDISTLEVDAVVNAANTTLLGGGGVDGAIHDAAGPELLEACRRLGGCPTGDAKITPGFNLRARYIIHAVGPIWRGGTEREKELLASCYQRSLELTAEKHVTSVAFPSISTGAFAFPMELAAPIAVSTVINFSSHGPELREVLFCCYSAEHLAVYRKILGRSGC
jgi:O-acetyl-ADP-ribose deacetylase (regulator of RNase III)